MGKLKTLWGIIRDLENAISRDQTFDVGAELAFWSILSIFPFAMVLLTLIGFLPLGGLDAQLTGYLYQAMPEQAARLVDQTIHEIVGRQRGWLLVFALLGALWSATGGTSATMTALNRAYNVAETRPFWKIKLIALLFTIGAIVAVIIATAALLIGPAILHGVTARIGLGRSFDLIWAWIHLPLAIITMSLLVAALYYFLPNVRQKFRIISPGSVTAVVLWALASLGFKLYVSHFNSYAKTYGALGTAVVLMMWVYISSLVMIIGSELNAVLDWKFKKIHHEERVSGPVTQPDLGQEKGQPCDNYKRAA